MQEKHSLADRVFLATTLSDDFHIRIKVRALEFKSKEA